MVDHLYETQMRLDSVTFRAEQYIDQNIVKLAEETLLDSIKAFANAAGVPPEYINSLKVVHTGWMKFEVILDYNKSDKKLGIWFEWGTRPHGIYGNPWLAFFWDKIQKFVILAKVRHPGVEKKLIMTRGFQSGMPRLANKVITETNAFLQETRIP